jgi:O-antigen/teichoic acid export membrane protein
MAAKSFLSKDISEPVRRLAARFEISRPVMDSIITRAWSMVSGSVTVLLIASFFTPQIQGYYYLFLNLLALQVFVDLNFATVLIHYASHEWAGLRVDEDGNIVGDPKALSRLASIVKFAIRWYGGGASIFLVGAGIAGTVFMSHRPNPGISWLWPWWGLVTVTGLQIALSPIYAVLEGCNQVRAVYRLRLMTGVCSSLALWTGISSGVGLWSPVLSFGASWLASVLFLLFRYGHFIKAFLKAPKEHPFDWKREMLPMQWRLAVSGIAGYFGFQLFTPTMFWFWGPVVAGQFGMTWQLIGAIQDGGASWLRPQIPKFGILIAQKKWDELDSLYARTAKISLIAVVLVSSAVWLAVRGLYAFDFKLGHRLLGPLPTAVFLLGLVLLHRASFKAAYLRSHKIEVLMRLSIVCSLLQGALVVALGRWLGPLGAAIAYTGTIGLIMTPWFSVLFSRYRREWHAEAANS